MGRILWSVLGITFEDSHGKIQDWWPGKVEESRATAPEEEKAWLGVGVRKCLGAVW